MIKRETAGLSFFNLWKLLYHLQNGYNVIVVHIKRIPGKKVEI